MARARKIDNAARGLLGGSEVETHGATVSKMSVTSTLLPVEGEAHKGTEDAKVGKGGRALGENKDGR